MAEDLSNLSKEDGVWVRLEPQTMAMLRFLAGQLGVPPEQVIARGLTAQLFWIAQNPRWPLPPKTKKPKKKSKTA